MTDYTVRLHARSLASKWGFDDGDCLGPLLEPGDPSSNELLPAAVRAYLAPLLPAGVELYEISSIHNPIRARDEHMDAVHYCDAFADVTREQVLAAFAAERQTVGGAR